MNTVYRVFLMLLVAYLLTASLTVGAAVIRVKSDSTYNGPGYDWEHAYHKISAAIASAAPGDQIWVAKGTYTENLVLRDGIALYGGFTGSETQLSDRPAFPRPENDPYASIINADLSGSAITIQPGTRPNTRIDGFTIRRGAAFSGGGISCVDSSATITNNLITENTASQYGGGIYCDGGYPTVIANVIRNNTASSGGGIYFRSSGVITRNTIRDNIATSTEADLHYGCGGGICASVESSTITENTIIYNSADKLGGGIICRYGCSAVISNNTIQYNTTPSNGGGIACLEAYATIRNNHISNNEAALDGGGISCEGNTSPIISSNTFIYNSALSDGGGIACGSNSSPRILGNTIRANTASQRGGAVFCDSNSTPIIFTNLAIMNTAQSGGAVSAHQSTPSLINNTFCDNSSTACGGILCYASPAFIVNNIVAWNTGGGVFAASCTPSLRTNCVYANTNFDYSQVVPGSGDINSDPVFVNKTAGDYHIAQSSPCRDAGSNDVVQLGDLDIDGQPRIAGPRVDIGADEWAAAPNYPPTNASLAPNSGTLAINVRLSFAATYSDPDGAERLGSCYLLINTALAQANAIFVKYDSIANKLYLKNDSDTTWLGGFEPGSPNSIQNTRCIMHCSTTTINVSATQLTVNWSIEIKPTMSGKTCYAWMLCYDDQGIRDGWDKMGTFTVASPPVNTGLFPNSGSLAIGPKITLTATYSDADGYQNLASCYLLINTTPAQANAVFLKYDANTNQIYLKNDADTAWLGGVEPGNSTIIQNSRCKLHCADTYISSSGTNLSISWTIELKPLTTGKTYYAWMLCYDDSNLRDGYDLMGTFVTSQPPANSRLVPTSGALIIGTPVSLKAEYSDADGVSDLASCHLLLNSDLIQSNAIFLRYDTNENKLYLKNDADTSWLGGHAPGSPAIIENTQCKLYCRQTSVSLSDNTAVVDWRIELKPTLARKTCHAWLLCYDDAGLRDGWDWMAVFPTASPPSNDRLTPTSGTIKIGSKFSLTATYSDADGYQNLAYCYLLLNKRRSQANAAFIKYDFAENKLYVKNDSDTAWLGGFAPGSANIIENSQCKLFCADTTTIGNGTSLTIKYTFELKPLMNAKPCNAWMLTYDAVGLRDGYDQMASFTVIAPPINEALLPTSGGMPISAKLKFTSTYSDADGIENLASCYLLINTTLSQANAAFLKYDANENKLYLKNDSNTAWLGGFAPGAARLIENSRCRLYCKETSISPSGNTIAVKWIVEFKPPFSGKTCNAWMLAFDDTGLRTGWDWKGNFTFSTAPTNGSLSPSSGTLITGKKLTFTTTYSDADGARNLGSCYLLLNRTLSQTNAVFLKYDVGSNKLYLKDDSNTTWLGGFAPGSSNIIDNNQCKLRCASTTISQSGTTLTIKWGLELKSTMTGKDVQAWMLVYDKQNLRDGWDQAGTFQVINPPLNESLYPNSGDLFAGTITQFTTSFSDGDGVQDLACCYLLINTTLSQTNAAFLKYDANSNKLYLKNDSDTDWLGGYEPGTDVTITNSRCTLYCKDTSLSQSGTTLTINWTVQLSLSLAGKTCRAWLLSYDDIWLRDGWDEMGIFTVW